MPWMRAALRIVLRSGPIKGRRTVAAFVNVYRKKAGRRIKRQTGHIRFNQNPAERRPVKRDSSSP